MIDNTLKEGRILTKSLDGVYCLANDKVLDWFIAFAHSLRYYNPDISVTIIPFDDNIAALSKVASKYKFHIIKDDSLKEFDQIGEFICRGNYVAAHAFRKLKAFQGPYENFLFLDSDVVVLSALESLFDYYQKRRHSFVYFDKDMDMVYEPGPFRQKMIGEYSAKGFNTGAFISSKGLIDITFVQEMAQDALPIKEYFNPFTLEQPFLNYCIDRKRPHILNSIDLIPGIASSIWANSNEVSASQDVSKFYRKETSNGKWCPFIHWAGYSVNYYMPHWRIYYYWRSHNTPLLTRLKLVEVACEDVFRNMVTPARNKLGALKRSLIKA